MTTTTTLKNLFTAPVDQVVRFREINEKFSLGFDEEDFNTLGTTLENHPGGLKAWTLEAMLRTPEETFKFITWNLLTGCTAHVNGLRKGTVWITQSLRWVLIDFGSHIGEMIPRSVIDRNVAHVGVFWQAVYSPQWLGCMGEDEHPSKTIEGVYIPQPLAAGLTLEYGGVD